MHDEVLSSKQKDLLPLVEKFSNDFGLIGGTAVALQLGHRRSIDFDRVTFSQIETDRIRLKIGKKHKVDAVLIDETNEYTLVINGVKFTYLSYPFNIDLKISFDKHIRMPDLLSLAAMKAYALGRRAKWKDYVDVYFIISKYSFKEVVNKAREIFGSEFNEKLFREQLAYFDDIDYTEQIEYMEGFEVRDDLVKQKLREISLQRF